MEPEILQKTESQTAYDLLRNSISTALETYSNVHRGSGHFSMVTTYLFDKAREIILNYLGLNKRKYVLIFCTPARLNEFTKKLDSASYKMISSKDLGLPFGIRALAIKRSSLPGGVPFQTGGGSARLIANDWVVWESAPERFELGTPVIINIIAFAKALKLIGEYGKDIFQNTEKENHTIGEILYADDLDSFNGRDLLNKLSLNIIRRGKSVPTTGGEKPFVNFDYAASTPTFKPVWKAVQQSWKQSEKTQKKLIQEVRTICAELLGAPQSDYQTVFTSNTTEAINLAAENTGLETFSDVEPVVLTTLLEHSSNDLPWRMVANHSHITLSINKEGFIDLNELDNLLKEYNKEGKQGKKRITIFAISGASNVLGTFNDLDEISQIVHKYGARLLVDGAQMVAHRKVNLQATDIDYFAFSAHKVYAPFGTGVLMMKKNLIRIHPLKMQSIHQSGEENVGGIVALGKALVLLQRVGFENIANEEQILTKKILKGLSKIPNIQVYGITDTNTLDFAKRGGVIVFNLKEKMSDAVAKGLALHGGIGIRFGCHCTHVLIKHILGVGPKLEKFQKLMVTVFPKVQLPGVARVSIGIGNTEEEVDRLIYTLSKIAKKQNNTNEKYSNTEVKKQIKEFVKDVEERVYS